MLLESVLHLGCKIVVDQCQMSSAHDLGCKKTSGNGLQRQMPCPTFTARLGAKQAMLAYK